MLGKFATNIDGGVRDVKEKRTSDQRPFFKVILCRIYCDFYFMNKKIMPATKEATVPYNITGPAIVKIFAPTPRI